MNTDGTFSLFKSLFRLGLLHSIYMLFLIRVWRGKRQGENSPPLPYRNFVQHTLLVLTQGGSVKKPQETFFVLGREMAKGEKQFLSCFWSRAGVSVLKQKRFKMFQSSLWCALLAMFLLFPTPGDRGKRPSLPRGGKKQIRGK